MTLPQLSSRLPFNAELTVDCATGAFAQRFPQRPEDYSEAKLRRKVREAYFLHAAAQVAALLLLITLVVVFREHAQHEIRGRIWYATDLLRGLFATVSPVWFQLAIAGIGAVIFLLGMYSVSAAFLLCVIPFGYLSILLHERSAWARDNYSRTNAWFAINLNRIRVRFPDCIRTQGGRRFFYADRKLYVSRYNALKTVILFYGDAAAKVLMTESVCYDTRKEIGIRTSRFNLIITFSEDPKDGEVVVRY